MKDYKFKINGNEYSVSVEEAENNMLNVNVNGTDYQVEAEDIVVKKAPAARPRPKAIMQAEAPVAAGSDANVGAGGAEKPIKTPLPGVVLDVFVKEGDAVKAGQKILLLEAMKMEKNIEADKDGVVKAVKVKKGDSVQEGDVLMLIA